MKSLEEMGKFATVVIDPPWPIRAYRIGHKNGYAPRLSVWNYVALRHNDHPRNHRIAKLVLFWLMTRWYFVGQSILFLHDTKYISLNRMGLRPILVKNDVDKRRRHTQVPNSASVSMH